MPQIHTLVDARQAQVLEEVSRAKKDKLFELVDLKKVVTNRLACAERGIEIARGVSGQSSVQALLAAKRFVVDARTHGEMAKHVKASVVGMPRVEVVGEVAQQIKQLLDTLASLVSGVLQPLCSVRVCVWFGGEGMS